MRLQVKICGLSTLETVDAAIAGGASHVGFVFFARSPRHLDFDKAAALAQRVPAHVRKVGVFAEQDSLLFDKAIAAAGLHVLQLHGTNPRQAAFEGARTGRAIWGVVPVRTSADISAGAHWMGAADRLLYDAKTSDTDLPGGMGLRFDWRLLSGIAHPLPWGLAGGLEANNLAQAVAATGAPLLDVSSGVESAPGVKDVDKISAFLQVAAHL